MSSHGRSRIYRIAIDIGTASGFLTWEAERRGAQVVSFDLDHASRQKLLPFRDSIYMRDRAESERQREHFFDGMKRGYGYCHHAFGSSAKVHYGNIERMPLELGHFDVALLCSVLEHLPDHIQAIASAASLANTLVITVGLPIPTTVAPSSSDMRVIPRLLVGGGAILSPLEHLFADRASCFLQRSTTPLKHNGRLITLATHTSATPFAAIVMDFSLYRTISCSDGHR